MMRSMFAGVSGMRSHQQMMDVIGDNIANVNSSGFKASRVVFQDALSQVMREGAAGVEAGAGGINPTQVGLGVKLNAVDQVITQGAMQSTGRPSDLAVQGNGYFPLRLTDGTTAFTRSGSFGIDNEGRLVSPSGGVLLNQGGEEIVVPEGSRSFSVGANGVVTAISAAGISTAVGTVGLAVFANPAGLTKGGDGNLRWSPAAGGAAPPAAFSAPGADGAGSISAGMLEMSNVDLAQEFTNMMIAQRGFQANSKIISTSDELMQELVNLKR